MKGLGILSGFLFLGIPLLALPQADGASASALSLSFKPRVSVEKETVRLGDIALIQGGARSTAERVAGLKVQPSPLPGEVLVLSRASLASWMERNGLSSLAARSQIPEQIEVVRRGRVVERGELGLIVEEHLQRALGDERKVVRVKEIQGVDRVVVPSGDLAWEVKAPPRFSQGGSISVSLALKEEDGKTREIRVHARVEILADVAVAKNALRRHQVVEERDVHLVNRNIARLPADVAMDLGEVVGKRATSSVNPQEILRASALEISPLVKKGDRVTLVAENGSFRITCPGEVREEGRAGERVRAVNISSKKEVYGRVVDAQTVLVDF